MGERSLELASAPGFPSGELMFHKTFPTITPLAYLNENVASETAFATC